MSKPRVFLQTERSLPVEIFLNIGGGDDAPVSADALSDASWSTEPIEEPAIKYIRADVVAAKMAQAADDVAEKLHPIARRCKTGAATFGECERALPDTQLDRARNNEQ